VRVYADSSFIVRLVAIEPASELAVDEFRRVGSPRLFFLPLHHLEVENAIRQRAFHARRSLPSNERQAITRARDTALARIRNLQRRTTLLNVTVDMDAALDSARQLTVAHTERVGARAIDLLHVGCARLLKSELFLSFDERQLEVARLAGLNAPALRSE
jgi:hypothetical protein